jgi:hypothetical protein
LELKNIILEEKLSNKLKNGHENFSILRFSIVLLFIAWMSLNHEVQGFTEKPYVGGVFHEFLEFI